jgi:acetoin:2,6-dichlorophenolindophenol oxidoreductase subunit beta
MTEQLTAEARDARTGSHLVAEVLAGRMRQDESIVVFGEDVAELGGVFGATRRLHREFGDVRVFDTPVSETAFVGMAVGAAQAGLRPIVELMFVDFAGVCFDQILNQMAKNHYMSGGEVRLPLLLRSAVGCIGSAAQHSQVLSGTFAHIPGLKVVFPGTPADLQRLLLTALGQDNPVIFLEHKWLLKSRLSALPYNDASPPGFPPKAVPFGQLRWLSEGTDIVIATVGWMTQLAMAAVSELANDGISAGVIDLRTIVPLDRDGLLRAASSTECLLVVDEDYRGFGFASEVIAVVAESLGRAAPRMARLAPSVPVPASLVLEQEVVPNVASIATAARHLLSMDVT